MQISRTALLNAISKVSVVSPKRPTLPVIANILIEIKGEMCYITATDLEVTMTYKFALTEKPESDLRICVSPKEIKDFLSQLESEFIDMEIFEPSRTQTEAENQMYNKKIKFEYGFGSFLEFPLVDPDEFPTPPTPGESPQRIAIDGKAFKELLHIAKDYTGNDEMRPVMMAVDFELEENGMRATATNANFLSTQWKETEIVFEGENKHANIMISPKAIQPILRLSPLNTNITISGNNIFFKTENIELSFVKVDGNFPKWRQVIPTEFEKTTIFKRTSFLKGIKLASLTANSASHQLAVAIDKDNIVSISSADIDFNKKGSFKMKAESSSNNEPLRTGYNGKFIKQIIETTPEVEHIQIHMNKMRASVLGSIDNHLILIMPMALPNN